MRRFRRAVFAKRAPAGVVVATVAPSRRFRTSDAPRARSLAREIGRFARRAWTRFWANVWGDGEVDPPRPRVLVKVRACSLNPVDAKYLYGDKCPRMFRPFVRGVVDGRGVGFDFSGVVVEADANAEFRRGQAVFGVAPPLEGACAEYVECYADMIAEKSANMTHAEAAAIGLCGATICQALDAFCKVVPSPVLVIGASGGLGHLAVQICKCEGAEVVGVSSARNLEFVRSLGVDAAAPYDDPDSTLEEHLAEWGHGHKKFKLILDTVTSNAAVDAQYDYCSRLREIVDDDCRYVKFGGTPTQWAFAHIRRIGLTVPFSDFHKRAPPFWIYFRGLERQLRYLRDMYDAGDLKPRVGNRFPFTNDGVREALALLRSRRAVGKVIIDIDEN